MGETENDRTVSARVAAFMGMVTVEVFSSELVSPVVSWSLVPKYLLRVRVEVLHAGKRLYVEQVVDFFHVEEGLPPEAVARDLVLRLVEPLEKAVEET